MQHRWRLSSWCSNVQGDPVTHGEGIVAASPSGPFPPQDAGYSDGRRRLALVLEYDGTRYKGFQWQSQAPSIQGEVEAAICSFTGESSRIRGASRTDAGVHATGQVVDFLSGSFHTTQTFVNALNWYLPPDIRVRGAWDTSLGFNSRKDAVSRVYRYTLLNPGRPSALMRNYWALVSSPLDVAKMAEAAGYLVGTHDFSALTSLPLGRSPVRKVARWDVWREGELIFMEAEANGFLPHLVRRTNGLLTKIGSGSLPVGVIKEIIDGTLKEPKQCPALPAKGLCLMRVNYRDNPTGIEKSREA